MTTATNNEQRMKARDASISSLWYVYFILLFIPYTNLNLFANRRVQSVPAPHGNPIHGHYATMATPSIGVLFLFILFYLLRQVRRPLNRVLIQTYYIYN